MKFIIFSIILTIISILCMRKKSNMYIIFIWAIIYLFFLIFGIVVMTGILGYEKFTTFDNMRLFIASYWCLVTIMPIVLIIRNIIIKEPKKILDNIFSIMIDIFLLYCAIFSLYENKQEFYYDYEYQYKQWLQSQLLMYIGGFLLMTSSFFILNFKNKDDKSVENKILEKTEISNEKEKLENNE